jgi:hypothetical protein
MVPIHDTDLAQERWSQTEWEHYELWEKLEAKFRRRKAVWIGAAVLLFFVLSSVPILIEHWPKWIALGANRKLSEEINRLKAIAGQPGSPRVSPSFFRRSSPELHHRKVDQLFGRFRAADRVRQCGSCGLA